MCKLLHQLEVKYTYLIIIYTENFFWNLTVKYYSRWLKISVWFYLIFLKFKNLWFSHEIKIVLENSQEFWCLHKSKNFLIFLRRNKHNEYSVFSCEKNLVLFIKFLGDTKGSHGNLKYYWVYLGIFHHLKNIKYSLKI